MSEYIIPLDEIESAMGDLGKTIYEAYKWREIVRCVDCKHWMDYEHEFEPNLGYCREFDREEVRDNNFCSFGERREQ